MSNSGFYKLLESVKSIADFIQWKRFFEENPGLERIELYYIWEYDDSDYYRSYLLNSLKFDSKESLLAFIKKFPTIEKSLEAENEEEIIKEFITQFNKWLEFGDLGLNGDLIQALWVDRNDFTPDELEILLAEQADSLKKGRVFLPFELMLSLAKRSLDTQSYLMLLHEAFDVEAK